MKTLRSAGIATLLALAPMAHAHITRIVIVHRDAPAYEGKSFGEAGRYERLSGHAYGELDPKDPLNAIITDIALAPRNARGMVEYSMTFTLAKPMDLSKASGVLIYDVANRGNIALASSPKNPGAMADVFRYGHVLLSSGWQGDLRPKDGMETLSVPVARNADGGDITGPVLVRFSDMPANSSTLAIPGRLDPGVPQSQPVTLDTTKATLTRRAAEGAAIVPIRSADWAFADCAATVFPGKPDPGKICLKGGFDPKYLYELVYTAKDPLVLGIGYAATRDLNSFFKHAERDDTGSPNVLAHRISFGIARGNSQSGNFLRSFVHLGFNQDESGKIVWEGINPNVAARQLAMNIRFVNVSGAAALYEPGSDAVLWWGDYQDTTRKRTTAGLLDRCRATGTCPKVFETFGSSEFWVLRASPDLVGTAADRDIPLPPNVRRYYFPGVTHGGGRGGIRAAVSNDPSHCELAANPNPSSDTMRALMVALVDWVVKDTPPPPSNYPLLERGDLTSPARVTMGFPAIPGAPLPDGMINPLYEYDFGSKFNYNDLSGSISIEPPVIRRVLPSLVPKVNADGNEMVGVASTLHQAPLGTYLGWNVTREGFATGRSCGNSGGYIPFAKTKAEREAAGDSRLSLEERYHDHAGYIAAVEAATKRLVAQRFLLPADASRLIHEAESSDVLR